MTEERAIEELTRAADLCPTTPLAEACRMAVKALRFVARGDCDCYNCKHSIRPLKMYPCSECVEKYGKRPSHWEPKEVDNGQND